MPMTILIQTFCALLITCAILVVQSANPVYSVLYLILAFFNASALVLLCGHDYMAALFIVLYVGAMCTFFLFAIMILDIKVTQAPEKMLQQPLANTAVEADRLRLGVGCCILTPWVKKNGYGDVDMARLQRSISQASLAYGLKNPPSAESMFDRSYLPPQSQRYIHK